MNSPLRVLMVDDSENDAVLLLHTLRSAGYEVDYERVETPAAMRAALERQDWDVITSDHSMPQFNAPEALALATELRPNLPFIIVSGEIDLGLAVSLMQKGARDYIEKRDLPRVAPVIERELREMKQRRERQHAKHALETSEARYRRLFEAAQDGILLLNANTAQIEDVNAYLINMLGYSHSEFLGKKLWEVGSFKDIAQSRQMFAELQTKGYVRYEDLPLRTMAGAQIAVEFVSNSYDCEGIKVIQCNIRNITERKRLEDQVRQMAFYDTLTKLPNRRLLGDRLSQAMAAIKRSGCYAVMMFLDLDNFKLLNDVHGHAVGDLLLIEAADRLKSCVREMDTVARFGGDEFVVMISELSTNRLESTAQAGIIAEKIRTELGKPFVLQIRHEQPTQTTIEHLCTASIGVALFSKHDASEDDILRWADTAMYQAKEAGRDLIRFYDS